jgi:hypothetical protein
MKGERKVSSNEQDCERGSSLLRNEMGIAATKGFSAYLSFEAASGLLRS